MQKNFLRKSEKVKNKSLSYPPLEILWMLVVADGCLRGEMEEGRGGEGSVFSVSQLINVCLNKRHILQSDKNTNILLMNLN